ncbi:hypothetical protein ACOMHN_045764 [Nucella lapillus]
MFLRGGGDIQLLRCGDVEANHGPDPEPSTSRPSASLLQTRISTPRKSSQSAKDPSMSEVMATLNSINSSLNSKMNGMNASLNGKMDGVKEDVGQPHQEFSTLSELLNTTVQGASVALVSTTRCLLMACRMLPAPRCWHIDVLYLFRTVIKN